MVTVPLIVLAKLLAAGILMAEYAASRPQFPMWNPMMNPMMPGMMAPAFPMPSTGPGQQGTIFIHQQGQDGKFRTDVIRLDQQEKQRGQDKVRGAPPAQVQGVPVQGGQQHGQPGQVNAQKNYDKSAPNAAPPQQQPQPHPHSKP